MVDIADFENFGYLKDWYDQGDLERVADFIRNEPEELARNQMARDFLADLILGVKPLPTNESQREKWKNRWDKAQEKGRYLENATKYIQYYKGMGIGMYDVNNSFNGATLAIEKLKEQYSNPPIESPRHLHNTIKAQGLYDGAIIQSMYRPDGIAVLLANDRLKPRNREELRLMERKYYDLSDNEREEIDNRAFAEWVMKGRYKRACLKYGESYTKEGWRAIRDEAVKRWFELNEHVDFVE